MQGAWLHVEDEVVFIALKEHPPHHKEGYGGEPGYPKRQGRGHDPFVEGRPETLQDMVHGVELEIGVIGGGKDVERVNDRGCVEQRIEEHLGHVGEIAIKDVEAGEDQGRPGDEDRQDHDRQGKDQHGRSDGHTEGDHEEEEGNEGEEKIDQARTHHGQGKDGFRDVDLVDEVGVIHDGAEGPRRRLHEHGPRQQGG